MSQVDMYFTHFAATQSEVNTKMLEGLAELARKLDHCVISRRALDNLQERFESYQEELSTKMPKAKKVGCIELRRPSGPVSGRLAAGGVTLLTIVTVRAMVFFGKDSADVDNELQD